MRCRTAANTNRDREAPTLAVRTAVVEPEEVDELEATRPRVVRWQGVPILDVTGCGKTSRENPARWATVRARLV